MVIIAVIAIFTVVSFPYYQDIRETLALDRATVKLSQDFRRAQEMTMSAYKFNGSVSSGGYGIYIDMGEPDHYILFADINPTNGIYDAGELVEDIYLEENVEFENCGPLIGVCKKFAGVYLPSDPRGFFKLMPNGGTWNSVSDGNVEISINGISKIINLNSVGLIDID